MPIGQSMLWAMFVTHTFDFTQDDCGAQFLGNSIAALTVWAISRLATIDSGVLMSVRFSVSLKFHRLPFLSHWARWDGVPGTPASFSPY